MVKNVNSIFLVAYWCKKPNCESWIMTDYKMQKGWDLITVQAGIFQSDEEALPEESMNGKHTN